MTDEWYVILNMNCKYEICRRCPKSGLFKGSLKECDDWIKQKQKDEIKDKISMALKDPLLQQGFEIICKENAELDCQMNRNKYCYSCVNATDKCFRKEIGCPCEKYKSYKDENAELKEQLGDKVMAEVDIATVAYMQGAERYKPKWHKVADGDLPGNYRYVWTNVGACYYDEAGWWDDFGRLQDVIAWCEPKFEE